MNTTSQEYDKVIAICRTMFVNKMKDYGSAWRILRLPSLTDQIYIKAQRIRSLQENAVRKVDEGEASGVGRGGALAMVVRGAAVQVANVVLIGRARIVDVKVVVGGHYHIHSVVFLLGGVVLGHRGDGG
jgi:hypothetical protein